MRHKQLLFIIIIIMITIIIIILSQLRPKQSLFNIIIIIILPQMRPKQSSRGLCGSTCLQRWANF